MDTDEDATAGAGAAAESSKTIQEFCQAEAISLSTYYKLKQLGLGPDELHILPKVIRITAESRREWRVRMQERAKTTAAELETSRRRELAALAGRRAAKSADHVSRRPRKQKRGAA